MHTFFFWLPSLHHFSVFRYGNGLFSFPDLVLGITKRFSTEFELQEVCSPHNHTAYYISLRVFRGKERHALSFVFVFFQLKKFIQDNLSLGLSSATVALDQAIEKTTANIKWVTENKAHVLKWLTDESTWEHRGSQSLLCSPVRDK